VKGAFAYLVSTCILWNASIPFACPGHTAARLPACRRPLGERRTSTRLAQLLRWELRELGSANQSRTTRAEATPEGGRAPGPEARPHGKASYLAKHWFHS
jgi:hypothetical protein